MVRVIRSRIVVWSMLFGTVVGLSGCEELGIGKTEEAAPPATTETAAPGPTPAPMETLPDLQAETTPMTASPEQIVESVLKMNSIDYNDDAITRLVSATPANSTVTSLNLRGSQVTAAGLAQLARLPGLRQLDLSGYLGRHEDWNGLSSVTQLEELSLESSSINDQTLAAVTPLVNLRFLNISKTTVTDAGFTHLTKLSQLETIYAASITITGAGFEAFTTKYAKSPLKVVNVTNTGFGSFGFAHLKGMKTLETIAANASGATDDSIENLRGLSALKNLHLAGNSISDKGLQKLWSTLDGLEDLDIGGNGLVSNFTLEKLVRQKALKKLRVEDTRCDLAGVQEFKKTRTDCIVRFQGQEF